MDLIHSDEPEHSARTGQSSRAGVRREKGSRAPSPFLLAFCHSLSTFGRQENRHSRSSRRRRTSRGLPGASLRATRCSVHPRANPDPSADVAAAGAHILAVSRAARPPDSSGSAWRCTRRRSDVPASRRSRIGIGDVAGRRRRIPGFMRSTGGGGVRSAVRRVGHRGAMANHRRHPDPGRDCRQRCAVPRILVGLSRLFQRGQPAAPRLRSTGEHVHRGRQRLLRHRPRRPGRHIGPGPRRGCLAHRAGLADPVLDPCRFPHQLPAHHGRRRRSRGARSRGRGGPRGCRRAVPDPRRRPRRAPACSTPHRPRRRGQRRQRDGAAAGRGRDAGRPHGRRIRARSRGRGPGALPRHRRPGSRGW